MCNWIIRKSKVFNTKFNLSFKTLRQQTCKTFDDLSLKIQEAGNETSKKDFEVRRELHQCKADKPRESFKKFQKCKRTLRFDFQSSESFRFFKIYYFCYLLQSMYTNSKSIVLTTILVTLMSRWARLSRHIRVSHEALKNSRGAAKPYYLFWFLHWTESKYHDQEKITCGYNFSWLKIRWLRFEKEHPLQFQFKAILNEETYFYEEDISEKNQGPQNFLVNI